MWQGVGRGFVVRRPWRVLRPHQGVPSEGGAALREAKTKFDSLAIFRERVRRLEADDWSEYDEPGAPKVPSDEWKALILETWRQLTRLQEMYCEDEITVEEWGERSLAVWEELVDRRTLGGIIIDATLREGDIEG